MHIMLDRGHMTPAGKACTHCALLSEQNEAAVASQSRCTCSSEMANGRTRMLLGAEKTSPAPGLHEVRIHVVSLPPPIRWGGNTLRSVWHEPSAVLAACRCCGECDCAASPPWDVPPPPLKTRSAGSCAARAAKCTSAAAGGRWSTCRHCRGGRCKAQLFVMAGQSDRSRA